MGQRTTALPRAAVIGAGSSGIAAVKALADRGIDVTCFEASDRVGGNWVFGNRNGMSAAYRDLHINTSRERMAYADFPMPPSLPDFPHHTQIARYFDDYVDHFALREHIRFETTVERAERRAGGGWTVTAGGTSEPFDVLLVANGHHWDQRWPEPAFPGMEDFRGEQLHAHDYRDNERLKGRDVVVLGMGNSAMDISVEASHVARSTYLAARRGAWIVPKYVGGKPADRELPVITDGRIPYAVRRRLIKLVLTAAVGKPQDYGLPTPDHDPGQAHPTVSGRILDRIAHGRITPKPTIARLGEDWVEFADGSRVHADVVIYCTGYRITFPFFDEAFLSAPDNRIELFFRVFRPGLPDLAFIGLLQPLGAIMPLAEAQSKWVAAYLRGEEHLPPTADMERWIRADRERMRKRYVTSQRHTIQVDFDEYLHRLGGERRAGAERARAAGYALPVPARTATAATG